MLTQYVTQEYNPPMSIRQTSRLKMYAELMRKQCAHCKESKLKSEFYNRTISPDGLGVYCKTCDNLKSNAYRVKFKDQVRKQRKQFRDVNKERLRFQKLKSKLGLDKPTYDAILAAQGGCCGICGKLPKEHRRVLSVDHDHLTGKVRGILCDNCNRCLGLLKDDVNVVEKAASYLKKHKN